MGVRFLDEEHNMGEAKAAVQEQRRHEDDHSPAIVMNEARLHETLKNRMESWRGRLSTYGKSVQMRKNLLHERLRVCLEIARLVQCLHNEKIICRGHLKVENIGFNEEGNVKLFGKCHDNQSFNRFSTLERLK
jgi:hypothetical protein